MTLPLSKQENVLRSKARTLFRMKRILREKFGSKDETDGSSCSAVEYISSQSLSSDSSFDYSDGGSSDCKRKVKFARELVTSVVVRPRSNDEEKRALFYTPEELWGFRLDAVLPKPSLFCNPTIEAADFTERGEFCEDVMGSSNKAKESLLSSILGFLLAIFLIELSLRILQTR